MKTLPRISISRVKSDLDLQIGNDGAELMLGNNLNVIISHRHHCGNSLNSVHFNQNNYDDSETNQTNNNGIGNHVEYKRVHKLPIQTLEHNYQSLTKLHLKSNKCRVCSETLFFHCYECVQCKLIGHKKCLQSLYVKCPNKTMPPRLVVFGLSISDNNQLSDILLTCVGEIERRPISKLKGIYRIEGDQTVVDNLCLSFEFGSHLVDLSKLSSHDIAGVNKEYLCKLSTPIFHKELEDELITLGKEWPIRKVPYTKSGLAILIFELRRLASYMTIPNRINFSYLMYHFKRISDRQNFTEMSANSLAIVFANIIFKSDSICDSVNCNYDDEEYHQHNNLLMNNQHAKSSSPSSLSSSPIRFLEMDNNTNPSGVSIVEDIPYKIRILELMIFYVNEIFS